MYHNSISCHFYMTITLIGTSCRRIQKTASNYFGIVPLPCATLFKKKLNITKNIYIFQMKLCHDIT